MTAEAPQRADIDGRHLEWAWHGPAADAAPTILLMHEGLGCVGMWRDFPARLAETTGCGVLLYSRAGYGASDPVTLPRPLTYMHDEAFSILPHLIEHFGLRRIILAGHSDGASIAAIYAGGIEDHRIRGVILISPHFFNEDICVATANEARANYESGELKTRLERHHGANVECAFYGWNDSWLNPDFMNWNIEEYLQHIRVPILLLWGSNDPYGTVKQVDAAEAECTSPLEVRMMQESSHWPFREEPEATMHEIGAFVSKLLGVDGVAHAGSA